MSGPKLSAYELEQRRREEVERIRRETVRVRSQVLERIRDIRFVLHDCDEKIGAVRNQLKLLENTDLTASEKERAAGVLCRRLDQLTQLRKQCAGVDAIAADGPLEVLEAEYIRSSKLADACLSARKRLSSDREYDGVLEMLAEELCGQVRVRSYTLEEALNSLPVPASAGDALRAQKNEMLHRCRAILEFPHNGASTKERIEKAVRRIRETDNPLELHDIASLVIGEIERTQRKIAPMIEQYGQLICTRNALARSLSIDMVHQEPAVDDPAQMQMILDELCIQIRHLEELAMEQAQRDEIARCIDAAMEELGYACIDSKQAKTGQTRISLYTLEPGVAIQVNHRPDGVVRMKVVGVAARERPITAQEQEYLYREQQTFCAEYEEIIAALRRNGVNMRPGTEKRLPADRQFSQVVCVEDYCGPDIASAAARREPASRRRVHRKPKNLSLG